MPLKPRLKRVLRVLLLAFSAFLLVSVLFPIWMPWLLRPIARANGLVYREYERQGYSRFRLMEVSYVSSGVDFRADAVNALLPPVWAWKAKYGGTEPTEVFAEVSHWQLRFKESGAKRPVSTQKVIQEVLRAVNPLKRWLPRAQLNSGTVFVQTNGVFLPSVAWSNGVLAVQIIPPRFTNQIAVMANFQSEKPVLTFDLREPEVHGRLELISTVTQSQLSGLVYVMTNRVQLEAAFEPQGALPSTGLLRSDKFIFPGRLIGLEQVDAVRGAFTAHWVTNGFTIQANAIAEPGAAFSNAPPVVVDISAHGSTNAAVIERLNFSTPWVKANLSRDLTVHYSGPLVREPVGLAIEVDFDRQKWCPLQGTVAGGVQLLPGVGTNRFPIVDFTLTASRIGTPDFQATAATLDGALRYPRLTITSGTASFQDEGSANVTGIYDLKDKSIVDGKLALTGTVPLALLPKGLAYDELSFVGAFSGSVTNIVHAGHLHASGMHWVAGGAITNLLPLNAKLDWTGQQFALSALNAELSNTNHVSLAVAGSAIAQSPGGAFLNSSRAPPAVVGRPRSLSAKFTISELSLSSNSQPILSLESPVTVSIDLDHTWRLSATPIKLSGQAGRGNISGQVIWPSRGTLDASLQGLHSTILAPWTSKKTPDLAIQNMAAQITWSNSPISGSIQILASSTVPSSEGKWNFGGREIRLNLSAGATAAGVAISNLAVSAETSPALSAKGFIPVVLTPGASNLFEVLSENPLQFDAQTDPGSVVWKELADRTGIILTEPRFHAELNGTPGLPRGTLQFTCPEIQLGTNSPPGPAPSSIAATNPQLSTSNPKPSLAFKNVALQITFDRARAELTEGRVEVQGQPLVLTGSLPIGRPFWSAIKSGKMPPWDDASGRILVKNAEVSSFSGIFPRLLTPEGEFGLDLSLLPNRKLRGELRLDGVALRPVQNLGAIRDIHLSSFFTNRTLVIQQASGDLGGSRVLIGGLVDLSVPKAFADDLPPLSLTLKGTNVPITKQPDLILRGDMDLILTKTNGAPPLVSGNARMRNSLFMRDLRDFVPGKVAKTPSRAPYFSIEEPLLAPWRFDVRVTGTGFLKVRSPIFNGLASANLRLIGTFKDPVALGDVRIDSGAVRFPFASLQVRKGFASVTSQNPTRLNLSLTAAATQFGYDITMQASGPADDPVVQFTSSPPLSSERILLMVTAGQMPGPERLYSTQQRAQTFAVFLGRDLLSKFGMGGGEQKLTVQSGEQISDQGKPTYLVEYKLSKDWSLVGEYDRFSELNVGVKWRIYSR